MADRIDPIPPISGSAAAAQAKAAMNSVFQESAAIAFQEWGDNAFNNPLTIMRRFERLDEKLRAKKNGTEQSKSTDEESALIEDISEAAEALEQQHPDLSSEDLIDLFLALHRGVTEDELLGLAKEKLKDPTLIDTALDFLTENSKGKEKTVAKRAKEELLLQSGREVSAGHNIGGSAYQFAEEGLGTATMLRELYRELTSKERSALQIFQELFSLYKFDRVLQGIAFLLASLGLDLNAKGPSIDPAQLKSILTDCQKLQGIVGVYAFFNRRMSLLKAEFERYGLELPKELNFESLSRTFLRILEDKYPSIKNLFAALKSLGLGEELIAQMLILGQNRDALRHTSRRLYRDEKHRQDLMKALEEAAEEIEDLLDQEDKEEGGEEEEEDE